MDRIKAYAALAAELARWRALPRRQAMNQVGMPPIVTEALIEGEIVSIEISVGWADPRQSRLNVTAVAYGPNHWRLERLEEAISLEAPGGGRS